LVLLCHLFQSAVLKEFKPRDVHSYQEESIDQVIDGHAEYAPASIVFWIVPDNEVSNEVAVIVEYGVFPKGDSSEYSVGDQKGQQNHEIC
jgi:hypothetical protein